LKNIMKEPEKVVTMFKTPSLERIKLYYLQLKESNSERELNTKKFSELLRIVNSVSFNQCVVFSNSPEKAKNIYDKLISQEYPAINLTTSQLTSQNFRIIVSYDSRMVRKSMELDKVNLVINFDHPTNAKKFLLNIGCAGQHGFYGMAVTLCNIKDLENLIALCSLQKISLSLLPKDITPEYFYYMLNPENINKNLLNTYTTNNTTSNTIFNTSKKTILSKGFITPFVPDHTYLINTEKTLIDLSPGAIQQLLYDQGDDEDDWFAEEQKKA